MLTFNQVFENKARQLLTQRIEEIKEAMSRGFVDNYDKSVGEIAGLRAALEICDEVNRLINNA